MSVFQGALRRLPIVTAACLAAGVLLAARQPVWTVASGDQRRPLAVRSIGGADMVGLDQLAALFTLALREDTRAGGMTVTGARQTAVVTPGRAAASIGGRVVTLSSAVVRDGRGWFVPLDFLEKAVAPATGQTIELRPLSRTVLVGDLRWPQVAMRLERQGAGVRLSAEITPATPFRLTRDRSRVSVRFDATAIDIALGGASVPDLIASVRADGTAVVIELGPSASLVRPAEDAGAGRFTLDVAPAPRAGQEAPTPPAAALRIVAIDAGHGGQESGARAADGTMEKTLTLALAQRLKTALESRLGVRVLMTRAGDDTLPLDRRAALVNNGRADLLITLHADGAFHAEVAGARVLTLAPAEYAARMPATDTPPLAVPIAPAMGGGSRTLDVIPWDLAQVPQAPRSAAFATAIDAALAAHQVPRHLRPVDTAPLRLLASANMPAVHVEAGFLTNADDAAALAGPQRQAALVDALVDAVAEFAKTIAGGRR